MLSTPPEGGADATVTMTREAFGQLLRGEPVPAGQRPSIRGDRAAVALLKALAGPRPGSVSGIPPHGAGKVAAPSGRAPMVAPPVSTPACAHLHVHSEYSLLDGAAKIEALAARAAAFGQPALGLTDHGVMNGSVELYKACKSHGIKPILGLEAYFVDDRTRARGQDRAQPPDAARRHRRGLPQPRQALERRLPRGPLPRQAGRRPRLPRPPRRGRHRAHRLPRLPLPPPHRRGPAAAGARPPRRPRAGLRPRGRLLRGPAQRHRRAGAGQRGDREASRRRWAARSSPPPTCTTCARRTTTTTPRCCACRPSRRSRSRRCPSTPTSSI